MALLIMELPFVNGAMAEFTVFPDRVRSHLMVIASASLTDFDPSFGDQPQDADGDGVPEASRVLYAPQMPDPTTDAGQVKTNLKTLVDRAATTSVYGVDWAWVVSRGGDLMSSTPAIQLGSTVIYDTSQANGQGRWFIASDGAKRCVMDAEILYHELVHVVKGHGSSFDPGAPAAEEREARVEEGKLERALGRPFRNPDRPEAGVGCEGDGPCCIVASVASGSPYADQVNRLRAVRDRTLRGTRLGEAWFDQLHREYYRFSVPIARSMVRDQVVRGTIADWFVEPYVDALELALAWAGSDDRLALGEAVEQRVHRLARGDAVVWSTARGLLDALAVGDDEVLDRLPIAASVSEAIAPLAHWLPRSPRVRWAVIDLLRCYADISAFAADGEPPARIGERWAAQMEGWLQRMPLAPTQGLELAPEEVLEDLRRLSGEVLTGASAGRAASRLVESLGRESAP